MNIPLSEVKLNDRARTELGDVEELKRSILEYGLIHPIALSADKVLIAGGRRFTALRSLFAEREKYLANTDEIDNSMVRFLKGGMLELGKHYTSKEDAELDLLDEMELEENVRRKNFTWKEEIVAIYKIHHRRRLAAIRDREKWGLRETGRMLGVSHASVQYALKLYECLQDPQHPVHNATSATDALHMLAKARADEARRLAVAKSITTQPARKSGTGKELSLEDIVSEFPASGDFDSTSLDEILKVGAGRVVASGDEDEVADDEVVVELTNRVFYGDFVKLLAVLPKVDHIITDPPYGIDMSNLTLSAGAGGGMANISEVEDTHQVDDNITNFKPWLQGCYDMMRENGFLVMFCDMVHWNNLRLLADAVGFRAQRWPFVWCKTHSCMNQAADFNFTKNFEVALVARKGAATLVKPQASSYLQASVLPTKRELSGHPFVKPLELWQHLAKAVALEGETIGDPFSGVGSMPRAVAELGFKFVTCEINEAFYNQQMQMLMDFYRNKFYNVRFI